MVMMSMDLKQNDTTHLQKIEGRNHISLSSHNHYEQNCKSIQDIPPQDIPPTLNIPKPSLSTKRANYLEWQEYFMSIAFLSAQRSKDPRTQVGACIVDKDHKIVGIGYNGMPIGCNDDLMPWNRAEDSSKEKWLQSKSPYVCHAELNAVLNKNLADIRNCSIYVALFPCNMCAQIIIQSRIKEVIYYSDKYHDKAEFVASRYLLEMAGVKYRQFQPRQKKIIIDFELIEGTMSETPTIPKKSSSCSMDNATENVVINRKATDSNNHSQPVTTNNNNMSMRRKFTDIEDRIEEQQLQQVNMVQFTATTAPARVRPHVENNESVEWHFAVFSWILMILITLFFWYISYAGLVSVH